MATLPDERAKRVGDRCNAPDAVLDVVEVGGDRAAQIAGDIRALEQASDPLRAQLCVREWIVDLVRDASRERAECDEAVRLDEPALDRLALGDVTREREHRGTAVPLAHDRLDLDDACGVGELRTNSLSPSASCGWK